MSGQADSLDVSLEPTSVWRGVLGVLVRTAWNDEGRLWQRMCELTRDPDRSVRAMAFHTITDGCPEGREADVVAALEAMYQDPDLKIRKTVRRHLAQYRRTGRINIL